MMKKFMAILTALLCLLVCFSFAACDEEPAETNDEPTVLVNTIERFAFTADDGADGTQSFYDYLVQFRNDGVILFTGSTTEDGFEIETLNKAHPTGNEFWAIYTTLTDKDGVTYASAEYGTEEEDGITFYSANYCVDGLPVYAGESYMIAIDEPSVLVNTSTRFAFTAEEEADGTQSLYDYLAAFRDDGEISFTGSTSAYGFYIETFNGTAPTGNEFWAVYTTLTEKDGVTYASAEYGTEEQDGIIFYSANYGVSNLPVYAGESYMIAISTY